MIKGIMDATAGMMARDIQQEISANNLANAQTTGFKKDRLFYTELVDYQLALQKGKTPNSLNQLASGQRTIYEQGVLTRSGNPMDVALTDSGFFVVDNGAGEKYTRNGHFHVNPDGILVTADGDPVMGSGGEITLESGPVAITEDGIVVQNGNNMGNLRIVDFDDTRGLKKEGHHLYTQTDRQSIPRDLENPKVVSGSVEESNVNVVQQMVEMIQLQRAFDFAQRSIHSQDETLQMAVRDLGSVNR